MGRARHAVTVEHAVDQRLPVDRVAERIAERLVLQRGGRAVVAGWVAAGVERQLGVAVGDSPRPSGCSRSPRARRTWSGDQCRGHSRARRDWSAWTIVSVRRERLEEDRIRDARRAPVVARCGSIRMNEPRSHSSQRTGRTRRPGTARSRRSPRSFRRSDLVHRVLRPDVLGQDRDVRLGQQRRRELGVRDEVVRRVARDLVEPGVRQVRLEVAGADVPTFRGTDVKDELERPPSVLARRGVPSDHCMPSRMWNVWVIPSSDDSHVSANPGAGSRFDVEAHQELVLDLEDLVVGDRVSSTTGSGHGASGPCRCSDHELFLAGADHAGDESRRGDDARRR